MITSAQRIARKGYLGSSDISAILGLDPFKNSFDIYISKTADLAEEELDNEAIEIGNDFEKPMIEWAGRKLNSRVETDPDKLEFVCKDDSLFVDHLDGLLLDRPGEGLESKSTSIADEWGEPGTDQVPERTIIQCQHHLHCAGLQRIHVPVLIGKFGLKRELYYVDRNDALIEVIKAKSRQFWNEHVIPRIPPDPSTPPSVSLLKRIKRQPGTWAEVPEELLAAWQEARDARLAAKKTEDLQQAALLAALGDAEGARFFSGTLTYLEQKLADSLDRDLLRTKHPQVYAEIAKPNTCRKLAFKKSK